MSIEKLFLGLIVLALIFVVLKGRKKGKFQSTAPKTAWVIGPVFSGQSLSKGMPSSPTEHGSGFYFDFPVGSGSVNYVQKVKDLPRLSMGQTLKIRFKIEGQGQFVAQDANASPIASLGFILQRKGDNLSGVGMYENYRWFSQAEFILKEGEFELSAIIDEHSFGGVMGGKDPAVLLDVLRNLGSLGLCFGSAGGRGHGVFVSAPIRFTLLSLEAI